MAQTLSELLVRLGVDPGTYYQELDKAQRRQKNWADSWKAIGRDVGAATALYATAFTALVKGQINSLDELDEAAQKTGASVRALSELNYAASLEGVEDFTGAMVKLNKSLAESANPASQQADALKALGVSATDAAGKMRSTDEVLMDIAAAFAGAEDGAAKSQIAMALFGKTGADLIPFLNNGAEGLARLRGEAQKFGITASDEAAASAGQLNDNLFRLRALAQGAANQVAAGLVPTLADMSGHFVAGARDGAAMEVVVRQIDTGVRLLISSGVVLNGVLQSTGKLLGGMAAAINALSQDRAWYEYIVPPLAISRTMRNFGEAAEAMSFGMEDAQGSATDMMESLGKLWGEMERGGAVTEKESKKVLTGLTQIAVEAKQGKDALKAEADALRDFQQALKEFDAEALRSDDAALDSARRRASIRESMLSPLQEYHKRIKELNDLELNQTDPVTYERAVRAAQELFAESSRVNETIGQMAPLFEGTVLDMEEMAKQGARNIQTTLADFLFRPFDDGLKGMWDGFVQTLRRMAAEAAAQQIVQGVINLGMGALMGGLPGADGRVIGGPTPPPGFANGGRFQSGWAMVGERGPELVQFDGSGTVHDAAETQKMLSGQAINVTINQVIQAPDTATGRRTAQQAATQAGRAVRDAMRRNG